MKTKPGYATVSVYGTNLDGTEYWEVKKVKLFGPDGKQIRVPVRSRKARASRTAKTQAKRRKAA